MTEAASAASDDTQARVHVPERTVPGSEPELREVDKTSPAQSNGVTADPALVVE